MVNLNRGGWMRQVNLLPADTFIVVNNTILKNDDRYLLTMLYQPIIGGIAINLYFTFWAYLDKKEFLSFEWTHHHLMSNLRLDLNSIIEAREKLEALGLLKTYYKKDEVNKYIYELYSPISAFDFFSSPLLNTILLNNVGKIQYKKLVDYFRFPKIKLDSYIDISAKFSDIYKVVAQLPLEVLGEDMKRHNYRKLEIMATIDLESILSSIPEEMLNHKSITNDLKEYIYKLSFIYNLNDFNTSELIKDSINEQRRIDKEKLSLNCENYFKFENKGKLPALAHKSQPEYLRKRDHEMTERDKMIYSFETTSPISFLTARNGSMTLTNSEKDLLAHLLIELNLKPGVVNVLIDYVLKINNNKLIKAFVLTIATQWKRSKIETVEQAMAIAEKEQKERKQIKTNKTVKNIETTPEWFDQKIEAKTPSEDRRKEIEEILKGYK